VNAPGPRTLAMPTFALVQAMVRAGLAEFAATSLDAAEGLPAALTAEAKRVYGRAAMPPWLGLRAQVLRAWPPAEGRLGELIRDFALTSAETFILGLAGAVEESHLVGLTLARLQAPAAQSRPAAHLAVAMAEALFGADALSIAGLYDHPLAASGVLALEGSTPLPQRTLRLHPAFWSLLGGRAARWPGCRESAPPAAGLLPASLMAEIPKLAAILGGGDCATLVLRGTPGSGRGRFAAALAAALGHTALEVPVSAWEQEPGLAIACRYARWLPVLRPQIGPGELWQPPPRSASSPDAGPTLVLAGLDGAVAGGSLMEIELPALPEAQRRALWARHLNDADLAGQAANALLSGPTITTLAAQARLLAARAAQPLGLTHIAEARALLGAERLRLLAQPVTRQVSAEALVLPPQLVDELDGVVRRCRRREAMWEGLGATLRATPGPGVRVLLVGESGTGKTLAASYLATALGAPLYRVDLAAVMNKYIGESEKNLGSLLDQAAANDVVLLFDEADSLFGRRSDRKETGERYANMLTNFLLTRIENHPGVVVLTSNSRERIDTAFTRRLDLILEVPLPGYAERLRLWRSHLGERGPEQTLCETLAGYCELAGGQIRNAVLTAAALTAAPGGPIGLGELLAGLRGEYRKIGRALPGQIERLDPAPPSPPAAAGPGAPT